MIAYLAITPARDEEQLMAAHIESMAAQTVLPRRWILIDDGSRDATGRLIDEAARRWSWIEAHHLPAERSRAAGGEAVVTPFLAPERVAEVEAILRLDADLTFESDFAARLLAELAADSRLGIVGPALWEPYRGGWREVRASAFHTRGAAKLYARRCFEAIGGLKPSLGWDTIDEATALMLGYRTRCLRRVRAYHHRPQGTALGVCRGRIAAGKAAYQAGYSPLFMAARAMRRVFEAPAVAGSLLMLAGFFEGYLRRRPRAASAELVRFVRRQQRLRLLLRSSSLWV
jgi:hypothetical protein